MPKDARVEPLREAPQDGVARLARAAGTTLFRFGCEPHVIDTLGLARRTEAAVLADQLEMSRYLRPAVTGSTPDHMP